MVVISMVITVLESRTVNVGMDSLSDLTIRHTTTIAVQCISTRIGVIRDIGMGPISLIHITQMDTTHTIPI